MKIRPAEDYDITAIVAMSRLFYETTNYARMTPMDDETVERLSRALAHDHVLLVAEEPSGELVGMVGLFVAPFLFDAGVRTAHEVVWWMSPAATGRGGGRALIEAAITECRSLGARAVQMVHLATSPPQAAALYEKLGFAHSESSYTLTFED
jgi:L-amino acid N-acyltransferase YncA